MESCPVKAAAAWWRKNRSEMKPNSEKLDLCDHKLSVGYGKLYDYSFGKLTPTKKKLSSISAIAGLSSVLVFAWHNGEREQAIKEFFLAFPTWANVPACPTPACHAPQQLHHSWELLGHDWLVPPLPSPKCQRGLALLSELAPGNLLQGSEVACSGARDLLLTLYPTAYS